MLFSISIHAPLRERRGFLTSAIRLRYISIHAPLRERPFCKAGCQSQPRISIHAPLRERLIAEEAPDKISDISIHAPLRERLNILSLFSLFFTDFNPRSLTGATCISTTIRRLKRFQSTLPYGSDRQLYLFFKVRSSISIHAPLRERQKAVQGKNYSQRFQSTLPYGSDC